MALGASPLSAAPFSASATGGGTGAYVAVGINNTTYGTPVGKRPFVLTSLPSPTYGAVTATTAYTPVAVTGYQNGSIPFAKYGTPSRKASYYITGLPSPTYGAVTARTSDRTGVATGIHTTTYGHPARVAVQQHVAATLPRPTYGAVTGKYKQTGMAGSLPSSRYGTPSTGARVRTPSLAVRTTNEYLTITRRPA